MATVRTVSGTFSIVEGSPYGVLSTLAAENVNSEHRIVGFTISGVELIVMYRT